MSRRFYYNGIKGDDGRLVKAWYSDAPLTNYPEGTITIYVRSILQHFPNLERLTARNDTDMMTDYFESDTVRVLPTNRWYPEVLAALQQQKAKRAQRAAA